jgi:hypothetical protein
MESWDHVRVARPAQVPSVERGPRPLVAGLGVLLLVLGYALVARLAPPDAPVITHRDARVDQHYSSAGAPPFLYFGSSASFENTPGARDRRTLAVFFSQHLGIRAKDVLLVAQAAFQPIVYRAVYRRLTQLPHRPRVILVPIEMRAFSAGWYAHPEYQHEELIASLERPQPSLVDRSLESLQLLPRPEISEWFVFSPSRVRQRAGVPVQVYGQPTMAFDDYWQFLRQGLRPGVPRWHRKVETLLRAHYLYDLDRRHPVLQALVDLGQLARQHGTAAVFYVAPLNLEDLRHYTGADAARLLPNIELVKQVLAEAGERYVLDIHDLLPASEFTDKEVACEHMTAEGRSRRAAAVADYVQAQGLAGIED